MAKRNGGTAVAEAPATVEANWHEVSSAVATAVAAKTHDRFVADLTRWRELVVAMADGLVPADQTVEELSEIGARLRLPVSAIRDDVAAIHAMRSNEKLLATEREANDKVQAEAAVAAKEIPELEAQLFKHRNAVRVAPIYSQRVAGLMNSIDTAAISNPRVWGNLDALAKEMSPHG